jgi:magnesium transporter
MNNIPFFLLNKKKKEIISENLDSLNINKDSLTNENYLNNLINKLEKEVSKLDDLVGFKKPDHELITDRIFYINKLRLFLEIKIYKSKFDKNNPEMEKLIKRLELLNKNINIIQTYNTQLYNKKQSKALDTLTVVNTIFLPLTLIVGYFGMNFKSMGCPTTKTGILTFKYGQTFVFILIILITCFTLFLFKNNLIPF